MHSYAKKRPLTHKFHSFYWDWKPIKTLRLTDWCKTVAQWIVAKWNGFLRIDQAGPLVFVYFHSQAAPWTIQLLCSPISEICLRVIPSLSETTFAHLTTDRLTVDLIEFLSVRIFIWLNFYQIEFWLDRTLNCPSSMSPTIMPSSSQNPSNEIFLAKRTLGSTYELSTVSWT